MRLRRSLKQPFLRACLSFASFALSACGSGGGDATTQPPAPVLTTVAVTVTPSSIQVGQTANAAATGADQNGDAIATGTVVWTSTVTAVAVVSSAGTVTPIAPGTTQIVATAGGKQGQATLTVTSAASVGVTPNCTSASPLQLTLGEIRTLTTAQISTLCVGGLAAASEYVLIPFNNSNVASSTTGIELTSVNTAAVTTAPNVVTSIDELEVPTAASASRRAEIDFRARERMSIGSFPVRATAARATAVKRSGARMLTAVAATPTVGSSVQLNASLSGNSCSSAKVLHSARVVSVTEHAIVFIDSSAPTGGYTDSELAAFGAAFESRVFALDTTNFGAPTDIDSNGRVGIFFTTGINTIPGPSGGGTIGGLFAGRDLFPATGSGACTASNEGEMFYMPVPDVNRTLNANYKDKDFLSSTVIPTLAHEFQHLINEGRRIYVNNAPDDEEVWLNEGLSHIAEELLYYEDSGNAPGQNVDAIKVRSSQPQLDAFNDDVIQDFGRLDSYLEAPATNSPFSSVDGLETRGAIWQLLRYSADQLGGSQKTTWRALVNTTLVGQANFNAVFGDIVTRTRNWAIAQFVDDAGFSVAAQYTHPSWNYRSIYGVLANAHRLPLATSSLAAGASVTLTLDGGGAAYVRFRVNASTTAGVAARSSAQPVPANVDFILVRTQ